MSGWAGGIFGRVSVREGEPGPIAFEAMLHALCGALEDEGMLTEFDVIADWVPPEVGRWWLSGPRERWAADRRKRHVEARAKLLRRQAEAAEAEARKLAAIDAVVPRRPGYSAPADEASATAPAQPADPAGLGSRIETSAPHPIPHESPKEG